MRFRSRKGPRRTRQSLLPTTEFLQCPNPHAYHGALHGALAGSDHKHLSTDRRKISRTPPCRPRTPAEGNRSPDSEDDHLRMTERTAATLLGVALLSVCLGLLAFAPAGLSRDAGAIAAAKPPPTRCRPSLRSDTAARQLVLVAEIAAEVIATEHAGSYAQVSPMAIHQREPTIAITRRTAGPAGAYLLSASGTANSYFVAVRAADGSSFSVRSTEGRIVHVMRECGKQRHW
jgi:hypothetical protein